MNPVSMGRRMILNPVRQGDIAIKGIVFDMDGTLCLPQTWMFAEMKNAVGMKDHSIDILTYISELTPDEQVVANQKIAEVERKAMAQMEPQPGLAQLMEYLASINIPKTICTRNLIVPVNHLVSNFIPEEKFHPIVTRAFTPPKPHPAPILHIAEQWGIKPENLIMVGDSKDDMGSGHSAGASTILIKTHANGHLVDSPLTDYTIDSLLDIIKLIEDGYERKA